MSLLLSMFKLSSQVNCIHEVYREKYLRHTVTILFVFFLIIFPGASWMNWSLISSCFLSFLLLLFFREQYERMRIDGISLSSVHIKLPDRTSLNTAPSTSQSKINTEAVPEGLIGTFVWFFNFYEKYCNDGFVIFFLKMWITHKKNELFFPFNT